MSASSLVVLRRWPAARGNASAEAPSVWQIAQEYEQHALAVQRYAYSICRSLPEAEDIAQDCFVRWMQAKEQGKEVDRPLAWLLRVAHHLAVDYVSRRPAVSAVADGQEFADPAPDPEAVLLEQDRRERVRHALHRLSSQELRCWLLRAEGLRYREIAEILGVQTGTVATFLVRATEKLSSM